MIRATWRRRQLKGGAAIVLPSYIYYADGNNSVSAGRIGRANYPDGSSPTTLLTGSGSGIRQISVANGLLYYAQSGTSQIGRANSDGSSNDPAFLTSGGLGATPNGGLVVTSSFIYFSTGTSIVRCNLDGTGVTTLVSGTSVSSQSIAVDASHIYWAIRGGSPSIARSNIDGSGVNASFITLPSNPDGVAIDASHVYYYMDNGNIGRANIDGTGAANAWLSTAAAIPQQLCVTASYIFWSTWTGATAGRANIDGTGANGSFLGLSGWSTTGLFVG